MSQRWIPEVLVWPRSGSLTDYLYIKIFFAQDFFTQKIPVPAKHAKVLRKEDRVYFLLFSRCLACFAGPYEEISGLMWMGTTPGSETRKARPPAAIWSCDSASGVTPAKVFSSVTTSPSSVTTTSWTLTFLASGRRERTSSTR